ncbi:MAG: hypothetical protein ABSH16_00250 [Sedimentisphaerales bacterium]
MGSVKCLCEICKTKPCVRLESRVLDASAIDLLNRWYQQNDAVCVMERQGDGYPPQMHDITLITDTFQYLSNVGKLGVKQDWSKDIVFMNPPYGGHSGDWIKKALEESQKGAIVVCLIVSSTDRSY